MGVYSTRNNSILDTVGIDECVYEPGIEAAMAAVVESEQNYNAIMQAVGIAELRAFEATGMEMVYEASDISGFFGKVKEFFRKILEKIKGIFKKFFAMFDSYTKSDKEFITKYKSQLLKANTRDFEYKGFNFDKTKMAVSLSEVNKKLDSELKTYVGELDNVSLDESKLDDYIKKAEDKSEIAEKLRGIALGDSSSSFTASEFVKELFMYFRSGEDTKDTLSNINVSDLIMNISENSKLKKEAEKNFKELEKTIKDEIKNVEKIEKSMVNNFNKQDNNELRSKSIKHANDIIQLSKEKLSILQVMNGAKLTALKDLNRQSKAICVALINYRPKNEGFGFDDDLYSSVNEGFLSNVVLK